jgi:hypothetical protein
MAFTQLTNYSEANWNNLSKSPVGPYSSFSSGAPDPNVIVRLGGWVSETVLAFTVANTVNPITSLQIDPSSPKTLDVGVGAGSPVETTTYWTVDVGSGNGSSSQWTINFATVNRGGTKTGTLVFTKVRSDNDYA